MSRAFVTLSMLASLAVVSCDRRAPAPSAAASSALSETSEAALARVQSAAQKLGSTLKTRLTEALGKGGPGSAIEVCAAEAQGMASAVKKDTGVTLGRSSTKLRNAADAPPAWVGAWLAANEGKKAADVKGIRAVVDAPGGPVARFLKPIELEAGCLACHGDPASIPPEVKAVLAAKYPGDRATGYQVGDLRGALWAEAGVAR